MRKSPIATVLLHAALVLGAAATLFPLFWMITASLMPTGEANTDPPPILPSRVTFEHYGELFTRLNLGQAFFNSTLLAAAVTLLSLLLNSMAGYAFAKLRFRGRGKVFGFLLAALVLPTQVAILPLFLLLREMHLISSYWGVILPGMASIFGIFLMRQYALSIPDELLDAARIDGASEVRIYWEIVIPADPGHPRHLHLPGDLERFPLASRRADRSIEIHPARGPGQPFRRARPGH